jgi:hypothetical protein
MEKPTCQTCNDHHYICRDSGKAPCLIPGNHAIGGSSRGKVHNHDWIPCPTCQTAKPTDEGWEADFTKEFAGNYGYCNPIMAIRIKDFIRQTVSAAVLTERQSCIDAVEKSTERWRTNHETGGVEALLLAIEAINVK